MSIFTLFVFGTLICTIQKW